MAPDTATARITLTPSTIHLHAEDPELSEAPGIEAQLPVDVHSVLATAQQIPHPYRNNTVAEIGWVAEASWWIRMEFTAPPAPAEAGAHLVLDGVDLVATMRLNGVGLGEHASLYRPFRAPLNGILRPGRNVLDIRLDPPLAGLEAPAAPRETARILGAAMGRGSDQGMFGNLRTLWRRKPVVDWGWDFAPPLPSIGVREARIELASSAQIAAVRLVTEDIGGTDRAARATAVVHVDPPGALTGSQVRARLRGGAGRAAEAPVAEGAAALGPDGVAAIALTIPDPVLWWPHDMGDPVLHRLEVEVAGTDERAVRSVGLRTIELDRRHDPDGTRHFRFLVNGVPIFARGACMVPPDMLAPSPAREREVVRRAAQAGMTMLRVWGGGGYASDAVLAAADEYGLLLWQDFPFTCSDQVETPRMIAEIEQEAEHQTRRLSEHACLALLAGNNEVHALHQAARGDVSPGPWGWEYFHRVLPEAVERECPDVAYWPGCPYGEDDPAGVNGVTDGDRHAWEVWHGLDLGAPSPEQYADAAHAAHHRRYRHDTGRFISEFGLLSAADEETLARWIRPSELTLDSPVLQSHICDGPGDTVLGLLAIETGLPADLPEYIRTTQALQAEGLGYGIEHYRRLEPHTTGTLIWQLNDAWPGMSWSLLDHSLREKPAYHAVRRAFAPRAISIELVEDGADAGDLRVWVANSTAQDVPVHLEVTLEHLEQGVLCRVPMAGSAPAHASTLLGTIPRGAFDAPAADVVVRAKDLSTTGPVMPTARRYLVPLREVRLPEPHLRVEQIALGPDRARVTVHPLTWVHGLMVRAQGPALHADDGCLDLAAGERAVIDVECPGIGERLSDLRVEAYTPPAGSEKRA